MSKVYKIRANGLWYTTHSYINDPDPDSSPIFTNLEKAKKKIRDTLKVANEYIKIYNAAGTPQYNTMWEKQLTIWSPAEVVEFELIETNVIKIEPKKK